MVDHSEKNSSHCAAWSRGELWLEARQGLASWGGVAGWSGFGIGAGWGWGVEQRGWGVGGGGRAGGSVLCTQQVAVQCVVRVAAKHWASGLQGTVEGTVGRGGGGR